MTWRLGNPIYEMGSSLRALTRQTLPKTYRRGAAAPHELRRDRGILGLKVIHFDLRPDAGEGDCDPPSKLPDFICTMFAAIILSYCIYRL